MQSTGRSWLNSDRCSTISFDSKNYRRKVGTTSKQNQRGMIKNIWHMYSLKYVYKSMMKWSEYNKSQKKQKQHQDV